MPSHNGTGLYMIIITQRLFDAFVTQWSLCRYGQIRKNSQNHRCKVTPMS